MEIDAVAVFAKVVEMGSFSGAARVLRMPKTTVSAKLAGLEEKLGVTLIQRTTRRLHVTEAGQTYYRHCALALKELELGEASLKARRDRPAGLLRLTAPVDVGHALLPRFVCEYLRRYPETSVELIVSNRIVDLVGEGVDLAIRVGELKDSTLIARKFFEVDFEFCATRAYLDQQGTPRDPAELGRHQVLMHSQLRSRYTELSDGQRVQTVATGARVTTDEIETIKAFTLHDQGIGWLPSFLIAAEVKAGILVPVLQKWKFRNGGFYSFVYPGQKYSSPNVKAFIDIAMALMKLS